MESLVGYESDDGEGKFQKTHTNRVNKILKCLLNSHLIANLLVHNKFVAAN